jgi:alpha-L-fucosidase 2
MNKVIWIGLAFLLSAITASAGTFTVGDRTVIDDSTPNDAKGTPDVNLNVNWAEFLGNLDPVWPSLPTRALDGPMIANGMLGAYLIQDKDTSEVRFEMSRADMYDVRPGFKQRKTNGYFKLALTNGEPTGTCRLDLWNAQIKADLAVNSSVLSLRAFADSNSDVIVFELIKRGPDAGYGWDWVPDNRGWAGQTPKVQQPYTPYPEPVLSTYQNCRVSVQDMPADQAYTTQHEPAASQHATAWRVIEAEGKTTIYTSTTHSYRASTAKQKAVDNINQAVAKGFAGLEADHRSWWHDYYQKSFVTLPHKLEWFHWMQMYKIASMTRADAPVMMDLTGPWFDRKISWNGVWANWNAQKHYLNVFTSNHPELSDSLLNTLWKQRANLYDAESDGYGISWGGMSALNLSRGKSRDAACLAWLLSLSWERYQCTLDSEMLHDKLYPLLKGAYNYMEHHYLFTGTDGQLHFKPGGSPEYFLRDENGDKINKFEDITFRIANMRWVCNTIIKIHKRYGNYAADAAACQATLDKLTPYCIDPKQGFMIGKDTPFAKPHRHDSHELAIFPFYEYTPDNPEQAEVILNTLAQHKAIGFQTEAMADSVWGIMRAMFGDGNDALWSITHPDGCLNHWGLSKTTTRFAVAEGFGYVEEVPFLADRVIQEMLLQSWGDDIIRVFPAVPDGADWDHLAFSDFRAKGAFLVTAKRAARQTTFIKVESLAGEVCKVKTDMVGQVKVASDFDCTLTDLGDGIVQIHNLKKGQWCILYTGESLPDLTIMESKKQPAKPAGVAPTFKDVTNPTRQ